ncbi:hypothetical protein MML48_6g00006374 [Holotrichia oblita]|uniref:Uncharacterized protein n=1 Tax=Holotrichia oblita TaxID=644536 RepID=A0ACB9T0J4_HOLOL|nr:hypothetical protein MML48_6g00006374 [Holotrichia oblita]
MLNSRRIKKRPVVYQVNKFIGEFADLKYNGVKVICTVCDKPLMCWGKTDCRRHVNSAQHKYKKSGLSPKTEFNLELIFMLMTCNLPFTLLNQQEFQRFWNMYSSKRKLPGRSTLQTYVPFVQEEIKKKIKSELGNKPLWLCVDEMIDIKKNSIVNVIARSLDPHKSSSSILLASKRLENCTSESVSNLILDTLGKFQLSTNQVLILLTNGGNIMRCVGYTLKQDCSNMLHLTCKIHALHLVAETIRQCYPDVDVLIANMKVVFRKYIEEFRKQCARTPEPPRSIVTHNGKWLQAAFYYFKHYYEIKTFILQFNPKEAAAIQESQLRFQNFQVFTDLRTIYDNYKVILEAIIKLHSSISLVESLRIIDDVYLQLNNLSDDKNYFVLQKFDIVLNKDRDFIRLREIFSGNDSFSLDPLRNFKDYFNYLNVTLLDVKRSFSVYRKIFSSQRTNLSETLLETYQMLQVYSEAHPI